MLFVRQECFSLLASVHSANALERNTSSNPQSKWLHRSHAALSSLSVFDPCDLGAVQERVLLFDACGCCALCVSDGCSTEEETEGSKE